jgi:Cu(I)/Ag(I) efflux system protein CusF
MKRHAFLFAAAAFALPAAALSPHGGISHHTLPGTGKPEVVWASGTIKKVDAAAGNVVIAHGPLDNVGKSSTTTAFKVNERGWLAKMKEGQPIRFVAADVDGAATVTRWLPAR